MALGAEDLPNIGSVIGGGASGAGVVWACWWVINRYRRQADDGETLAERRMAGLNQDFDNYRDRTDEEIGQLRDRLDEYRDTNDRLRSELADRDRTVAELRFRLLTCEGAIRELRGLPPPGPELPPGALPHGVG